VCDASRVPWYPDLFSAPVLERIRSQAADGRASEPVPYFAGVQSGETDALVGSFASEPELHHPVRGRVRGRRAFERFVSQTNAWLTARNSHGALVTRTATPERSIEETVLTLDGEQGRIELPVAVAADRHDNGQIVELRVYYGSWPLTGSHTHRPPVLQPDPDLEAPDVVGEYQRALAAGDLEATIAVFEDEASVREPAGGAFVHSGREQLIDLYRLFFSNGGGIPLEHCAITDDGTSCALEYNVVSWGRTELAPSAGLAVYVRGSSGKLAAARIYDDSDPPLRFQE
jgi:SnoaL-like domain